MTLNTTKDKLKSFIFDDDELVTYKWLSKKIGVHVNVSKQMLWEFWQNFKAKVDICVSFVIMGQLPDGSERIEVVGESNLSSAKEKFVKINCEHIYSLQKTLSDLQTLALTGQADFRFTAIKCKASFLKFSQNPPDSQPTTKFQSKNQINVEKKKDSVLENIDEKLNSKSLEQISCQTEDLSPQNENKEKIKKTIHSKEKKNKIPEKNSKKPVQSLKAGFQNMFGQSNSKNLSTQTKENNAEKKSISFSDDKGSVIETNNVKMEEKAEVSSEKDDVYKSDNEYEVESKTNKQTTSKKNSKRKLVNESKNRSVVKKRKRILSNSDSNKEDSVSSESEEERKEDILKTEIVEEFKKSLSSPDNKDKNAKHIIRKKEDICFVDQDGFLVTKKITVSAEATEDFTEERLPPTSCKEKNINRKQTKQSRLTSFFKKS